jgi:arginine utilization protein RocB
MISKVASAAAVAALMFAAVPVSAMKMASCNQKNMDNAMLMKMPDGENKTNGMQEMTSAKSSMSQKDMAGCQDHMNKAMKMGMMKSKKM